MQHDPCYGLLARRDILHYALCMVVIGADREASEPRYVEGRQHVAVGRAATSISSGSTAASTRSLANDMQRTARATASLSRSPGSSNANRSNARRAWPQKAQSPA